MLSVFANLVTDALKATLFISIMFNRCVCLLFRDPVTDWCRDLVLSIGRTETFSVK
jgi:hypothetical protein